MKCGKVLGLVMAGITFWAGAEEVAPTKKVDVLDPLTCRWTFGNHEPLSMYRRAGRQTTGGVEGGALWLEEWHRWFDSEACPALMQELGLNFCHCRFYKGMGWDFESRDFPNVKRLVENAHRHGVRVLAYVQFSTLYYETMLEEIPDLADWAAIDENGKKRTYHGDGYYRWMPCMNAPGFEPYLKKVIRIALNEGGFDGVMLDNAFMSPCHCSRCTALFREYLAREPDPEHRFGIPTVRHVMPPPPRKPAYGELQDPVEQAWIRFRSERLTTLYERLYAFTKSCNPKAVFSANICNIRRSNMANSAALDMHGLGACFDLYVSQSGNAPGLADGCIINRIREMKLAKVLSTPILALCDEDAGLSDEADSKYFLPLMEDAVFGGIPTDRTVMKPDRNRVSPELVAFRRPLLKRFNTTLRENRESFSAPTYAPLHLLYSRESMMFSEKAYRAVLSAEEILLRNHLPYGLLPTAAGKPLKIPSACSVLLVCDQRCLSESEVAALVQFATRGGRLIVTGESGAYDPSYRQRRENPLVNGLAGCGSAVCRTGVDTAPIKGTGWTIQVGAPTDGGRRLLEEINKLWQPELSIQAPATVFAEVKRSANTFHVHLLNYAKEPVAQGARIGIRGKHAARAVCTFAAPLENRLSSPVAAKTSGEDVGTFELPAFREYALLRIDCPAASESGRPAASTATP